MPVGLSIVSGTSTPESSPFLTEAPLTAIFHILNIKYLLLPFLKYL